MWCVGVGLDLRAPAPRSLHPPRPFTPLPRPFTPLPLPPNPPPPLLLQSGIFRVPPEVEAQGLDVSHHGGSAYPHDKTGPGKGVEGAAFAGGLSSDMVDRKIEEALEKYKKDMSNGTATAAATTVV